MLNVTTLIKLAFLAAQRRAQLLFLLTILAGLISSVLLAPAIEALQDIQLALLKTGKNQLSEAEIVEMFSSNLGTFISSYIALLATVSALLPFWARAVSPLRLTPWDADTSAYIRRVALSFFHLLTAAGLTLVLLTLLLILLGAIGAILGGFNSFLVIIVMAAVLWASLFFSAVANIAIIAASTDRRLPFAAALLRARFFVRPIIGTLALLLFLSFLAENILTALAQNMADVINTTMLTAFIHGAAAFLTTAFHISVLQNIPGISPREPDL